MEGIPFLFQQVFSNNDNNDNDSDENNIKNITEEKTENKEYIGSGKQNQNMMIKDDKIIHTALSKKESPRNKQIQKKNKDIVANFTIIVNKYQ